MWTCTRVPKCHPPLVRGGRNPQEVRDGPRRSAEARGGPRRSAVVRGGPRWSAEVRGGPRRPAEAPLLTVASALSAPQQLWTAVSPVRGVDVPRQPRCRLSAVSTFRVKPEGGW